MEKTLSSFIIFCGLAGIFLLSPATTFGQEIPLEKIFYLAPYNIVKGVESLQQNWQNIDIVAPQYYTITSKLYLQGKLPTELKQVIAEHNLKVMPLIANANFSQKTIHDLLVLPNVQNTFANTLVAIAKKDDYIGWQFDFENISYKDKDLFTAFVQRVYPVLKKNNLIFSVAAVPRTSDFEDTNAFKNWGGAYDYEAIANSTDFVSLMTYDDDKSVGPPASVAYVNNVLAYVKDKIPPAKLSLGIPLYYWKWSVEKDKRVGTGYYSNVTAIINKYKCDIGFDAALGVPWLTYFFNNSQYKVWYENVDSFQQKVKIVKDNNFRGFSAWLLGGEDPAIWSQLNKSH